MTVNLRKRILNGNRLPAQNSLMLHRFLKSGVKCNGKSVLTFRL